MGDSVPHNQFWTKCTFYPRVSIHIYFYVCLEWISDKNYLKIKYFDTAWSRVLIVSMPICPVTSSSENEDSQSSWIVTKAYHGYGCHHGYGYHTILWYGMVSWVWMPLSQSRGQGRCPSRAGTQLPVISFLPPGPGHQDPSTFHLRPLEYLLQDYTSASC